jgi:hypothetical protein
MKIIVKHKRVGGNGLWWTLCGRFGIDSDWKNTWPAVTCKLCWKAKGNDRDYLHR